MPELWYNERKSNKNYRRQHPNLIYPLSRFNSEPNKDHIRLAKTASKKVAAKKEKVYLQYKIEKNARDFAKL